MSRLVHISEACSEVLAALITREHLAATYDDDQETTRMDAETARKTIRDAINAAKGGTDTEETQA